MYQEYYNIAVCRSPNKRVGRQVTRYSAWPDCRPKQFYSDFVYTSSKVELETLVESKPMTFEPASHARAGQPIVRQSIDQFLSWPILMVRRSFQKSRSIHRAQDRSICPKNRSIGPNNRFTGQPRPAAIFHARALLLMSMRIPARACRRACAARVTCVSAYFNGSTIIWH